MSDEAETLTHLLVRSLSKVNGLSPSEWEGVVEKIMRLTRLQSEDYADRKLEDLRRELLDKIDESA